MHKAIIYLLLLLITLISFSTISSASLFVVRPDANNGSDSTIEAGNPDTTGGTVTSLYTGLDGNGDGMAAVFNVSFLCDSLGSEVTIDEYLLEVWIKALDGSSFTFAIYPINCTINEQSVTWNILKMGTTGCYNNTNNLYEGHTPSIATETYVNITINNTWLEEQCDLSVSNRNYFLIKQIDAGSGDNWHIRSSDYYATDSSVVPRHYVTYSLPTGNPTTPTIIAPYDNEVNNTRNFLFYSTDADGDRINYSIYINSTLNITTATNITVWNASDGYYNLTISAFDGGLWSSNCTIVPFTLDTSPPIVTNINCTSCNPPVGDISSPYTTTDTTPTFTLSTNENANCRIGDENLNYSDMNASRDCSTTGTTSHTCTLTPIDTLFPSTDYVYIACEDDLNNQNLTSSTPLGLQMDLRELITTLEGDAWQFLQIQNYTNYLVGQNLTVCAFNPNSNTDFSEVNITPDTDYGSLTSIQVATKSRNCTSFYRTLTRPTTGDAWENISGATITGNISMTTNLINMINPIDPPHAWSKDGIVDCSQNPMVTSSIHISNHLRFIDNIGSFIIGASLRVPSYSKNNTNCKIMINSTGELVIG